MGNSRKGGSKAAQRSPKNYAIQSTPERIVDKIVDLMTSCQWSPQAARDLQKTYGFSETIIRQRAAEASRKIRFILDDKKPEAAAIVLSQINTGLAACAKAKNWNAFFKGCDIQSRMLGLYAPQKVELSGELANLTDEQLEARRQAIASQVLSETLTGQRGPVYAGDQPALPPEKPDDAGG